MFKLKFIGIVTLTLTSFSDISAIQVIYRQQPIFEEHVGTRLGEGLAEGINKGLQARYEAKKLKKLQEAETRHLKQEAETIEWLISNYDSSRHSVCIAQVLTSNLRDEVKTMVTKCFNDHYNELKRQKLWANIKVLSSASAGAGFLVWIGKKKFKIRRSHV